MVEITSCIRDRCADVLWFEVREIRQDFLLSRPIRKHVEDVLYTNTHSANARTAAAFAGLDANTLKQIRFHVEYLDILDICRQVAPWNRWPDVTVRPIRGHLVPSPRRITIFPSSATEFARQPTQDPGKTIRSRRHG